MKLIKESPERLIGRTLGEFVILEKLGEGGFGAVYRAEQPVLAREAVIKVMRNKHNADQKLIERFKKEALLASRLEHPYTASIYAFGAESDGLLWIAMELVNGTPLSNLLKVQGPISLERFVPLLEKICEVVHTAHESGIIHRDLKPSNVMVIARAGRLLPKLLDFGIAKGLAIDSMELEQSLIATDEQHANIEPTNAELKKANDTDPNPVSKTNKENAQKETANEATGAIGSPRYMAPELWEGGANADFSSDIYALGVLAYESLTGNPPFALTDVQLMFAHMFNPVPPLGNNFSSAIDQVIAKAMAKHQADRYHTAIEFATALREAAGMVEVRTPLPQLEEFLRDDLLANAPKPLASAVANLCAARNCYQTRDRIADILQVVAHYLGVLALACRVRIGSGRRNNSRADAREVLDAIEKLSQGHLNEREWLALAQALCRPFLDQRDAYPIPELISFFFAPGSDQPTTQMAIFEPLIEMCKARITSDQEAQIQALLGEKMHQLVTLLRGLAFLSDYKLVVAQADYCEQWMGHQLKEPFYALHDRAIAPNHPILANAQGEQILSLWPLVQVDAPTTGTDKELFFFQGKGRNGARFVALPLGFERDDENFWEWFGQNLFDTEGKHDEKLMQEQTPYLGLTSFSSSDAQIFFGRERETENFLNRLRTQSLLVVAGPSGAGKSSFVQAGVVPWLENCRVITLRPGAFPLITLRSRLQKEGIEVHDLKIALQHNRDALGQALRAATEIQNCAIVLIIDQFEELFTLCQDQQERELFALALSQAARSEEDSVRVVLTVRDDFLLKVKELSLLGARIVAGLELLATPGKEDLIRILVEPAHRAGYHFEDKQMPIEMVDSVAGRPGALPLLAFTAAKLWELRDRQFKQLRRKTYQVLGGVGGALASHAEEMMQQMTQHEQKLVRDTFRRLVTSAGTRAVLTRKELYQVLGGEQQAREVVEKLVTTRLVTASESEDGGEQIEVVHEALLSAWPRLVKWRKDDEEGARLKDQLQTAARQWQERGRPKGLLWRDEALVEYKLWRRNYTGNLTEIEEAFATASLSEATRTQRQKRIAATIAATVLVVMSVIFYGQNQQTRQKVLALYEEQGRQALLTSRSDQAVVYLSESYRGGNSNNSLKFLLAQALLQFDGTEPVTLNGHKSFVFSATFSPDGKHILSSSADLTAKLWDTNSGKVLQTFNGHRDLVRSAVFSADGQQIITASADATARIWQASNGQLLLTLMGHNGAVNNAVFSPDGKLLATAGMDRTARIWQRESGKELLLLNVHKGSVNSVAFSSDSKRVVTASADNLARIWDAINGKLLITLTGHENSVNTAVFSPDNSMVLTASSDNSARLWDSLSGKELRSLKDHTSLVNSARFSANGRLIITASADRTIKIWDTESGKLMVSLKGHDFPVNDAAFSGDGLRAVSASQDDTLKIWNVGLEQRDAATIADIVVKHVPIKFEGEGFAPNPQAVLTAPVLAAKTSQPNSKTKPAEANLPRAEKISGTPAIPTALTLKNFSFVTAKLDEKGIIKERVNGEGRYFTEDLGNNLAIDMVAIPAGKYLMGEAGCQSEDETCPGHEVTLSAFYMGKFEVTQAQWKAVMGSNPSHFKGDNLPVEQVTWYDAMEFCQRLSQQTGKLYRLPSEAEWEYAGRAGSTTNFSFGVTINPELVNYDGTIPFGAAAQGIYRQKTVPVGSLGFANGFGLYDMHGNVSEWCLDPLHENYKGAPTDGSAWIENGQLNNRMIRGGAFNNMAALNFSMNRNWNAPSSKYNRYGLRLVYVPAQK